MPTQSGTYATPRLDLAEAVMQMRLPREGFIGDRILTPAPAAKKTGTYSAVTRASIGRARTTRRAKGAAAGRDSFEVTDMTYTCLEYAHEQQVEDTDREFYQNDFDAEQVAALLAVDVLEADRERRVRDAIINTTTFTGASLYTDNSGTSWATAGTDTRAQVLAARELVRKNNGGVKPNKIVLGAGILPYLAANTALNAAIQYSQIPTVKAMMNALAAYWDLEEVLVGGSVENSADEGLAFVGADFWDKNYASLLCVAAPGAATVTPCIGRSMVWTAMQGGMDVYIDQYREEQTKSDIVRANDFRVEKVHDTAFGHLMKIAAL